MPRGAGCRASADAASDNHVMKMRADRIEGQNAIARHGPEGVAVNGVEHTESVVVPWRGDVTPWQAESFESLARRSLRAHRRARSPSS